MRVDKTTRAIAIAMAVIGLGVSEMAVAQQADGDVRPAYCAGTWYPGTAAELTKHVDDLLARADPPKSAGKPLAVIAPHAGYRYSAPVAAAGYRYLRGHSYKRVIVLAFSHRGAGLYQGVDVPRKLTSYETPIGRVPIDREVCDALLGKPGFVSNPYVDRGEHSLELQLPFLQRELATFRLVPLLVGRMTDEAYVRAAEAILPWIDGDTLLVASSDFTHFGSNFGFQPFKKDMARNLGDLADRAAAPLLLCDFDGFAEHLKKTGDTICGRGPISLLLRILSMRGGASSVRAAFDTSGNILGDWNNSVTYQSFVFMRRPGTLDERSRSELLRLARATVEGFLVHRKRPEIDTERLPPALKAPGACFVTLENHGRLRGCIGNMKATDPLFEAVIQNAISACTDYRFAGDPVSTEELGELHIEISYLTPMKRVELPNKIIVGRDGLHISLEGRRGVLLPQVAYERGWTRTKFLEQVCKKAGLPSGAWKRPEAEIYSFRAEVFGEPE